MNDISYQFERGEKVLVANFADEGTWVGYIIDSYEIKTASGEWVPVYEVSDDKYADDGTAYGDGELHKIES